MATPRAPHEHGRIRRPSPLSECGSAVTLTERWHDGTEARAGASEGPSSPPHEPAQAGFSNLFLFDNPAISINDSAPDLVATAHRQATQAGMLPLPCLHKAGHQSQPHATA